MKPAPLSRFDADYYRRFYLDEETAVVTPEEVELRAAAVYFTARAFDAPIRRVLDVGGGIGLWASALKRLDPKIHYTLLEPSPSAVAIAKAQRGKDIDAIVQQGFLEWRGGEKGFDLVLCAGVVQYFDDKSTRSALHRLARLTRYVLFFETFTKEDVDERRIDARSDDGFARPASFYLRALRRRGFVHMGASLFFRDKAIPVMPWELDRGARIDPRQG